MSKEKVSSFSKKRVQYLSDGGEAGDDDADPSPVAPQPPARDPDGDFGSMMSTIFPGVNEAIQQDTPSPVQAVPQASAPPAVGVPEALMPNAQYGTTPAGSLFNSVTGPATSLAQALPHETDQGQQNSILADLAKQAAANKQQTPEMKQVDPYAGILESAQKNIDLETQGMQQEANAKGNLGNAQGKIYDQAADQMQQMSQLYSKNLQDLTDHTQEIYQGVMSGQINPNHYWENLSTGNKVMTGIALALGALGGAASGGKNAAVDVINQSINRDIAAQKMNLDNKKSLLSVNLELLRSLPAAEAATRMQMLAGTQAMLDAQAAKAAGPLAQAARMQATGQIQNQLIPLKEQIAAYKVQQQIMQYKADIENTAGSTGLNDVPAISLADKEIRERIFRDPVSGRKYFVNSVEDAKPLKEAAQVYPNIISSLSELEKMSANVPFGITPDAARTDTLLNNLATDQMKFTGLKRFNKEEFDMLRENAGNPNQLWKLPGIKARLEAAKKHVIDAFENEKAENIRDYKPANRFGARPVE